MTVRVEAGEARRVARGKRRVVEFGEDARPGYFWPALQETTVY
jgi:hypothetical protein